MTQLSIVPWPDPLADVGHDMRSDYVERFWLPSLGPTAYVVLRHFANTLDLAPAGSTMPMASLAAVVGVGVGRHQPLARALKRIELFGFIRRSVVDATGAGARTTLAVRRFLPSVSPKHEHRLPAVRRRELELLKARAHPTST